MENTIYDSKRPEFKAAWKRGKAMFEQSSGKESAPVKPKKERQLKNKKQELVKRGGTGNKPVKRAKSVTPPHAQFTGAENQTEILPPSTVTRKVIPLENGSRVALGFDGNFFDLSRNDRELLMDLADCTQNFEQKKNG